MVQSDEEGNETDEENNNVYNDQDECNARDNHDAAESDIDVKAEK